MVMATNKMITKQELQNEYEQDQQAALVAEFSAQYNDEYLTNDFYETYGKLPSQEELLDFKHDMMLEFARAD